MTEAEWLECTDPQKMLEFLRDKVSDRRLRLTACAGFRKMMHLLPFRDLRNVISVEEQYADGAIGKQDANDARIKAHTAMLQVPYKPPKTMTARWLAETLVHMASSGWMIATNQAEVTAYDLQLIYDIFSNPFRSVIVDPRWLTWDGSTIPKLAQEIYDERKMPEGTLDNTRLAVLADALEEAGCTNADILDHCRKSSTHVRGCWVVDLLLGKE
jgi:hypothetical protein